MSYQRPNLDAYNQLQRIIYQSKEFKHKKLEVRREKVQSVWKALKSSDKFAEDYQNIIKQYKRTDKRKQSTMSSFLSLRTPKSSSLRSPKLSIPTPPKLSLPTPLKCCISSIQSNIYNTPSNKNQNNNNKPIKNQQHKPEIKPKSNKKSKRVYINYKQNIINAEIIKIDQEIAKKKEHLQYLYRYKEGEDYKKVKVMYKQLLERKQKLQKKIHGMKLHNSRVNEYRKRKRISGKIIKKKDIITDYNHYEHSGRPRIEQLERGKHLAEAMQKIADENSCTDPRRRTDTLQVNYSSGDSESDSSSDDESPLINQKKRNKKTISDSDSDSD